MVSVIENNIREAICECRAKRGYLLKSMVFPQALVQKEPVPVTVVSS